MDQFNADDSRKATNITWHESIITRQDKEKMLNQQGILIWFTGLSAVGKSTLAHAIEHELYKRGRVTSVLDGDNIRHGLNKDLGFSPADRTENIRRIGEVGKLFALNGIITMTAFISPYRSDRDMVRANMSPADFIEIYLKCPLSELEKRDPKGLYKKAHLGLIKEFTGVSAPYEEPLTPEIVLNTNDLSIVECVNAIMRYLIDRHVIDDMPTLAFSA